MIDNKKLDLRKCLSCNRKLKNHEEICSIITRTYMDNDFIDSFTSIAIDDDLNDYLALKKEIHFHLKCFEQFAGEDFIP